MQGEIGMKIKKIQIKKFEEHNYEMTFYDEDNKCFHIVGDNDLVKLLNDALENVDITWFQGLKKPIKG